MKAGMMILIVCVCIVSFMIGLFVMAKMIIEEDL